jgi:tRNA pseudouridine38-40 synthase
MSRYKIIIQYDGNNFSGFQSQKNKSGIQDQIESSLSNLNNNKLVKVFGASRTDAGVHALGQVAHFDIISKLSDDDLLRAINARLNKEIRVSKLVKVDDSFHSRFGAKSKKYEYFCCTEENPLFLRNHHFIRNVDFSLIQKASKLIEGEHNFLSFSKFSGKENNLCKIFNSEWLFDDKNEQKLSYIVHGNRFLHHMVRYLVGTMIAVGQNKISIEDFLNLLNNPKKDAKIFKAPSKGLILKEIFYEN